MNKLLITLFTFFPITISAIQLEDADYRELVKAIAARNLEAPGKYASRDEVSLFEKITNAYIRNYEKILTVKKEQGLINKRI